MSYRQRVAWTCLAVAMAAVGACEFAMAHGGGLAAAGITGVLVAVAGVLLVERILTRPLEEIRDAVRHVAAGAPGAPLSLAEPAPVGEIAAALRTLSEERDSRDRVLSEEQAMLAAVTASVAEGLVAINGRRQVVWMNGAAQRLLNLYDQTPFAVSHLPRAPAITDAVAAALDGVVTEPDELHLWDRILAVSAQPLAPRGAVLAVFDLTHLRRLEGVRREFVANASHELRTPLTAIRGFSETLLDEGLPPALAQQFARSIHANAERMQRLIDELLDLSRVESGAWTPRVEPLDVRQLAGDAVRQVADQAARAGITISIDVRPGAEEMSADPVAARQVLENLVDNALRHTPSAGHVTVLADPDERGGVWLRVRDTGAGIPPEHLPRIFERFYRVDGGRARDEGGTGLGLAIVKHLVEAHGGLLAARSQPKVETVVSALFPARTSDGVAIVA